MFDKMKAKMEELVKMMTADLAGVKTGRAKPNMIEQVMIEAYEGQRMPLVELASISAPDPHMLMIQPWDQSIVKKIEAGLRIADLQLNPVVDGQMIRISVPPLTEEKRRDLVKLVKQKLEGGKEMMRGVRNDEKREIDHKKGEPGVSEDDIRNWLEEMQKIFEGYTEKLEEMGKKKEGELMEI